MNKPQKGVGYQPRPEQEMPPLHVILERLSAYKRDPQPERQAVETEAVEQKYPALHAARLKADALILRRGGTLLKVREQYVGKVWTAKAEAS